MSLFDIATNYLKGIPAAIAPIFGGKRLTPQEIQEHFKKHSSVEWPSNPAEKRKYLDQHQEKMKELMDSYSNAETIGVILHSALLGEYEIIFQAEGSGIERFSLLQALGGFMYGIGVLPRPHTLLDLERDPFPIVSRAVKEVDTNSFEQALLAANVPSEQFLVLIKVCRYLAITYKNSDPAFANKLAQIMETLTLSNQEKSVLNEMWELNSRLYLLEKYKTLKLSASEAQLVRLEIDRIANRDDLQRTIALSLSLIKASSTTAARLRTILEEGTTNDSLIRACTEALLTEKPDFAPSVAELCFRIGALCDQEQEKDKAQGTLLFAHYIAFIFIDNRLMCSEMKKYLNKTTSSKTAQLPGYIQV